MNYTERRVIITVKTYPEPSAHHTETVCTAGLDEASGAPVRLYPVPLRYLENGNQYKLYDEVSVPIRKSTSDPRPESYKIDAERIRFVSHMGTEGNWRERKALIARDQSWHFRNMEDLHAANRATNLSLAMVQPGRIEEVRLTEKAPEERAEYEKKCAELKARKEADLFDPIYKELEWLPYHLSLLWTCREPCPNCERRPHRMKVLDWGLLELGRGKGWDKAVSRLEALSDLQAHDFGLYLGTFRLHPRNFGIIGLWYPKVEVQQTLL